MVIAEMQKPLFLWEDTEVENGAVCKTAGLAFMGSNPTLPTMVKADLKCWIVTNLKSQRRLKKLRNRRFYEDRRTQRDRTK